MNPATIEWVEKAEEDFIAARREVRARKDPVHNVVCFHAQQCAEKYLKARLCEARINFAKTHDLVALLKLVLPAEPLWEMWRPDLAYLTDFAAAFRYPGESADRDTARDAFRRCRKFRAAARIALGLRPE